MHTFIIVFFSALTLLWTYVGLSLLYPVVADTQWEWALWAFLLLTYALQAWRWSRLNRSDEKPRTLLITHFALGLMIHFFVAAVIKDIAGFFVDIPLQGYWILILSALGLNILSLVIGLKGPTVRTVKIKTGLQGDPIHIVQISDLHVGPIIRDRYVRKVVNRILPLKPDLIVATGDIGDGQVSLVSEPLEILRELTAESRGFYVPGNHEFYWQGESWIAKMQDLQFQPLLNEGVPVSLPGKIPLWVGGVPDPTGARFNPLMVSNPHKAISSAAEGRYKLLLAHQPKSCFEGEKAGFDLMMCGHTHGGQFFPFTFLVGFFNPYSRGLNQHGNMKVYVNVGTGFWGPPLRFGARAEITRFMIS